VFHDTPGPVTESFGRIHVPYEDDGGADLKREAGRRDPRRFQRIEILIIYIKRFIVGSLFSVIDRCKGL
jgi:hypothetical protein